MLWRKCSKGDRDISDKLTKLFQLRNTHLAKHSASTATTDKTPQWRRSTELDYDRILPNNSPNHRSNRPPWRRRRRRRRRWRLNAKVCQWTMCQGRRVKCRIHPPVLTCVCCWRQSCCGFHRRFRETTSRISAHPTHRHKVHSFKVQPYFTTPSGHISEASGTGQMFSFDCLAVFST